MSMTMSHLGCMLLFKSLLIRRRKLMGALSKLLPMMMRTTKTMRTRKMTRTRRMPHYQVR